MSSAFRMAHTVWVRQSANGDCVISIEYYLELLNHVSKNWEVLTRRKYTDYNSNRKSKVIGSNSE